MTFDKSHPLYREDIGNILSSVVGIGDLRGKRILLTGATGMVGVMLVDALMNLGGVKVCTVGRSISKARERLGAYFGNPDFSFLEHDVMEPFDPDLDFDYIIPAASNTHPLAYSLYPVETMMINIKGAYNALSLAESCGATLVYPSTNEIYGEASGAEDFTEDSNGRLSLSTARSCYNESKRSSEALCQSFLSERGVKVKIARLCRVFGPTMLPGDSKASSQFIFKAVHGEDIVLKSSGEQYFSYTYVADAVAGLLTVLLHGEVGQAYNVSTSISNIRLKDFARLCADEGGTKVVFDCPSETERKGYSLSTRSILSGEKILTIGFKPLYPASDAIPRTIRILKVF